MDNNANYLFDSKLINELAIDDLFAKDSDLFIFRDAIKIVDLFESIEYHHCNSPDKKLSIFHNLRRCGKIVKSGSF